MKTTRLITGDINLDNLVKTASVRFLHCTVTISLSIFCSLGVNRYVTHTFKGRRNFRFSFKKLKKKKLKENNLHSISIYLPTYLSSFYLYYWFNLFLNTAIK